MKNKYMNGTILEFNLLKKKKSFVVKIAANNLYFYLLALAIYEK